MEEYTSYRVVESKAFPGVRLRVRKVTFGRRIELLKKVSELASKVEFLRASDDPREQLEASLLQSELDRAYLLWGLASVEGIRIDGEEATPEKLVSQGPEELCGEALRAIKREFGLSEEEEKN